MLGTGYFQLRAWRYTLKKAERIRRLVSREKSQKLLSMYLKAARTEQNLTQEDLAQHLKCKKSKIEKMESAFTPSPVINLLDSLQELANLRDMDLDVFVSMLVGKKNESGESNLFLLKVARLLTNTMETADLAVLMEMMEEGADLKDFARIGRDYSVASEAKRSLYHKLKGIDHEAALALTMLFDYVQRDRRKKRGTSSITAL